MKYILIILLIPNLLRAQLTMHSRGAGMGDVGIAAANVSQTMGYNIGKTVFANHFHQASVSYLPYMRTLYQDTKFIRADYFSMVGESTSLGIAVNYLDLGNLTTRDDYGASLAIYRNVIYNLGASVGLKLSESSGIGSILRFVGERGFDMGGPTNHYGISGDLHYYQSIGKFSLGAVVNNLGSDLWQASEAGFGIAYRDHDQESAKEWTVGMDIRRPLKGSFAAMRYTIGGEIGFVESFFIRSGLSLEHRDFGNRKYVSLGAGYKGFVDDQSWGIDLHYQIPFGLRTAFSPIQNAYGMSLYLNIGSF